MSSVSGAVEDGMLRLVPNLRAFAVSLCGNIERADDLVQETLIKAWTNWTSSSRAPTCAPGSSPSCATPTTRTAAAAAARWRTATASRRADLAVHPEQHGPPRHAGLPQGAGRPAADQREALILVGAAGFSYEEAAEICGCALGTIKSRVNRARSKLIELLSVSPTHEYGPDAATEAIISRTARGGSY